MPAVFDTESTSASSVATSNTNPRKEERSQQHHHHGNLFQDFFSVTWTKWNLPGRQSSNDDGCRSILAAKDAKHRSQLLDDRDDWATKENDSATSSATIQRQLRHQPLELGSVFDDNCALRSCLVLLSSSDLDLNRVGLQRLTLLIKGRALWSGGGYKSEELVSHSLVYGGPFGSTEDRLRYVFSTLISDAPHDDSGMNNSNNRTGIIVGTDKIEEVDNSIFLEEPSFQNDHDRSSCDSSSCTSSSLSSSNDDDDGSEYTAIATPQGKAWGALHTHALRVLASALSQVASTCDCTERHRHTAGFLNDAVWRTIVCSLVHNIETTHTADTTGYSLKILRLLHTIDPETVTPFLQHTLFPHLVYLQEYGEERLFPMIHSEATSLIRRATQ